MTNQGIQTKIDTAAELLIEARLFYETSNFDESERCTHETLKLLEPDAESEDIGDERDKNSLKYTVISLLAHAYNRLATISSSRGELALTLSQAQVGVQFSDRIGAIYRKASLFTVIGSVYGKLSDYAKALEYYENAMAMNVELGNKAGLAVNLGNIGNVYGHIPDYAKELEYHQRALAMDEELGVKHGVARHLGNIGNAYGNLLDYTKALEYLQKSLALSEELGHIAGIAINLGRIGDVYCTKDFDGYDLEKAEEYLLKAIAMNEEIGSTNYHLHKILGELYERQERWKESQYHFKKFYIQKEEVHSQEAKNKANQLDQQKQVAEREKEIAIAKAVSDAEMNATTSLLHKVLPPSIASRLMRGEKVADYFTSVSILFADIVGFTPIASKMPARKVLAFLNFVFGEFDRIIEHHGCEKIKTIGDGYMAVAGAPIECSDHAERIARAACEMMGDIQLPDDIRTSLPKGAKFSIRIGIHIGPAFGGIVGENRFVYDIYSDAVNTAARMESHGEPGRIHVSEDFAFHLQNRMDMTGDDLGGIVFVERDEIEIKGKGKMKTYFLEQTIVKQ